MTEQRHPCVTFLFTLFATMVFAACGGLSNEEITCYAWKESGGAYISDNLAFGDNSAVDMILHSDRSITLRDTLIGVVARANSVELVIRLPNGEEAEFRKLVRTCK